LIESPGAPTEFPGALFDVPLSGPDGVISLVLDGEVDQRLSAELDELLRSVRESTAREVVVELEHVTGMDSCGVDFLSALATLTKARGGQLRLADPPPAILALFELAHDGRLPGLVEASTEGWNRTLPA
jgi:anti-anti-sigma factor